tara:strand:+ start:853 stop:1002 length:150 start_codon:yes stop_codon:yes gene_type:complete
VKTFTERWITSKQEIYDLVEQPLWQLERHSKTGLAASASNVYASENRVA